MCVCVCLCIQRLFRKMCTVIYDVRERHELCNADVCVLFIKNFNHTKIILN